MDNYIEKCIMHTLFIRIEYVVKLVRFFLEKIGGELKSYLASLSHGDLINVFRIGIVFLKKYSIESGNLYW